MTRLLGRKRPGDDGSKYAPKGYVSTENGPQTSKGKGTKEMNETCTRLASQGKRGCPFSAPELFP